MTSSTISSLKSIIKVLYWEDGSIRSFLTQNSYSPDNFKYAMYTMYYKEDPTHRYYQTKIIWNNELLEILELLKSPIEKIDRTELENY